MSFFSQLASAVASNLFNSSNRSSESDPLKVMEVHSSSFVSRNVCRREQCLVMYGDADDVKGYELVMAILIHGTKEKLYRYFK